MYLSYHTILDIVPMQLYLNQGNQKFSSRLLTQALCWNSKSRIARAIFRFLCNAQLIHWSSPVFEKRCLILCNFSNELSISVSLQFPYFREIIDLKCEKVMKPLLYQRGKNLFSYIVFILDCIAFLFVQKAQKTVTWDHPIIIQIMIKTVYRQYMTAQQVMLYVDMIIIA